MLRTCAETRIYTERPLSLRRIESAPYKHMKTSMVVYALDTAMEVLVEETICYLSGGVLVIESAEREEADWFCLACAARIVRHKASWISSRRAD